MSPGSTIPANLNHDHAHPLPDHPPTRLTHSALLPITTLSPLACATPLLAAAGGYDLGAA